MVPLADYDHHASGIARGNDTTPRPSRGKQNCYRVDLGSCTGRLRARQASCACSLEGAQLGRGTAAKLPMG